MGIYNWDVVWDFFDALNRQDVKVCGYVKF